MRGKEAAGDGKADSSIPKEEVADGEKTEHQGEEAGADAEEVEVEEEVFDCTAGPDVKELGVIPSAFAPDPVQIASVTPDSWAAQQGIEAGDMLLKINGTAVEAMDRKDMKRAMRERPLALTMSRLMVFATPEESIADVEVFDRTVPESVQEIGLIPSAFPPAAMVIEKVLAGTWAANEGIQAGDELVGIGQLQVQNMTTKETKRAMRERPLHLVFQRAPGTHSPAPRSSVSAPPSKVRKSHKPPPDMLTQAANQARKSFAAILPEGLNPLAPEAKLSCTVTQTSLVSSKMFLVCMQHVYIHRLFVRTIQNNRSTQLQVASSLQLFRLIFLLIPKCSPCQEC